MRAVAITADSCPVLTIKQAILSADTEIPEGTPHDIRGERKPPMFLQPGDAVTIKIDGLNALTNPVVAEGESA
jgi:hypothetical protein